MFVPFRFRADVRDVSSDLAHGLISNYGVRRTTKNKIGISLVEQRVVVIIIAIIAAVVLIASYPVRLMISGTEAWMSFAAWVTSWAA